MHSGPSNRPWNTSIELKRFDKATSDSFHVLDTESLPKDSLSADLPHLFITGTTGNLCTIHFLPNAMTCSCPDHISPCKHVIFVLLILRFNPSPGNFTVLMSDCTSRFRNSIPFQHSRLSHGVNQICKAFITHPCTYSANLVATGTTLMCDRCQKLMHEDHVQNIGRCPVCQSH